MKSTFIFLLGLLISLQACKNMEEQSATSFPPDHPIALHPDNPHYFIYKNKALALITSAEHYGAVLNLDFDYRKYLETLAADGMNYTRIFTGVYYEIYGESFGIQYNTLAPKQGRVITPWQENRMDGLLQYDLASWNEAYFSRLHDFMALANELDIIVEVTLFSSIYRDEHWDLSPMNPENNINMDGPVGRLEAQVSGNDELFSYQEMFVRKMVQELNPYNNFFFEIQNEPWADHAVPVYNIVNKEELRPNDWQYKSDFASEGAMAWQAKIAGVISDEEQALPKQHLIAQNYANFRASIPAVKDNISIINFHYAWPDAVRWNYHYDRVIGFDESGFSGSDDETYRRQAWKFMLSGGGLFNNLDYSFFPGYEDGTGENSAPGGGSKTLRKHLKHLSDFLHSFELEKLQPDCQVVQAAPGLIPYVLSDKGNTYAIYLRSTGTSESVLSLYATPGTWEVGTMNTLSGERTGPETLSTENGLLTIAIDIPDGELALKVKRKN